MATAVVLVSDRKFLVPTVGTALSARSHISSPNVPIFILVTNAGDEELTPVKAHLDSHLIYLKSFPVAEIAQITEQEFNKTHVPVATMARLWIADWLDPRFDRFLYLDGDVDITSSLDSLLGIELPANGFLAAPDVPMLIAGDFGNSARQSRLYLDGLGVTDPKGYFNAGVLVVDTAGWKEIGREAWSFFKEYPERCLYHDQSALNAIAGTRRRKLSLLWNYQSDFMAVADPRKWGFTPAIWHFTGFPKAWQDNVFPWKSGFGKSFALGARALSKTGWVDEAPASEAIVRGIAQREKLKWRLQLVYPWRRLLRSQRIRASLEADVKPPQPTSEIPAYEIEKLKHQPVV